MYTIINELKDKLNQLVNERKKLDKLQSELQQELSDLYHTLELHPLNAVQMSKLVRRQKTVLIMRRETKDKLRYHQSIEALTKSMLEQINGIDKNIVQDHNRWIGESQKTKDKFC